MPADLLAWARMPKGGQNAKIPPSLKILAVLKKKFLHQTGTALWYKSNYVGELKALGFGAEGS